ncbi:hypothetical protein GW17_00022199 [Ensete ventricosum]|nr:hypothetical protein GW17_00022199 [Ensete ventricosum]RZR82419.1 hypothetical protein BHM03_00008797 [Ensete ventricosum]
MSELLTEACAVYGDGLAPDGFGAMAGLEELLLHAHLLASQTLSKHLRRVHISNYALILTCQFLDRTFTVLILTPSVSS